MAQPDRFGTSSYSSARARSSMATVASAPDAAVRSRRFTAEEDSALLSAVRVRGTKWTEIVGSLADSGEQHAALARFGAQQLGKRFYLLRIAEGTKARAEAALDAAPIATKRPPAAAARARTFTAEEDSVLLTAVRQRNTSWKAIKIFQIKKCIYEIDLKLHTI